MWNLCLIISPWILWIILYLYCIYQLRCKASRNLQNSANKIQSRGVRDRSDPANYHLLQQWLVVPDVRLGCVHTHAPWGLVRFVWATTAKHTLNRSHCLWSATRTLKTWGSWPQSPIIDRKNKKSFPQSPSEACGTLAENLCGRKLHIEAQFLEWRLRRASEWIGKMIKGLGVREISGCECCILESNPGSLWGGRDRGCWGYIRCNRQKRKWHKTFQNGSKCITLRACEYSSCLFFSFSGSSQD